jgi:hypothetical protein
MYVQAILQTPPHWNQIDSSITTLLPVLSPSNILPPLFSHFAIISCQEKFNVNFKNVISKEKNAFLKSRKLKLCNLWSVCTVQTFIYLTMDMSYFA